MFNKILASTSFVMALLVSPVAMADDIYASDLVVGADLTEDFDTKFGYVALTHSFNGDIRADGFVVKTAATYGHYSYDDGSMPGGVVDGYVSQGNLLGGYKVVEGDFAIWGLVGLDYNDLRLTPDEATSVFEGSNFGIKAVVEGELNSADTLYLHAIGEVSSIKDSYFTRLRAGPNISSVSFGPEIALLGEDGWQLLRYGGYMRFGLTDQVVVAASGGNAKTLKAEGGDGSFATISLNFSF